MEETLGKRISLRRKALGLTQDALAEQLGVTPQAVSKWENDQSCPDIAMLPKLAQIFDCTTDALLGIPQKEAYPVEVIPAQPEQEEQEPDGIHIQNGHFSFQWDGGQRSGFFMALWLLLTGGLSMASALLNWGVDPWHIAWSSGVMMLGLSGLRKGFRAIYLGAFVFGAYFLLWHLNVLPAQLMLLRWEVVIPGTLLILGICTLADCLRKPQKRFFPGHHAGKPRNAATNHCTYHGETFDCATSFGENHHRIDLPRLSYGKAELSFGNLVLDLTGCEEIADGCTLELNCSFGDMEVLIPRGCRVESSISTAFAASDISGAPAADASATIYVNGSTSFGDIRLRYL